MTGQEFERTFCKLLQNDGYWALNIARNQSGAQPFDVIAVKGKEVLAIDCKVCAPRSFPLSRIEDNQWSAFSAITKASKNTTAGIMIFHDDDIYWLSYKTLFDKCCTCHSVKLESKYIWKGKSDIVKSLGHEPT